MTTRDELEKLFPKRTSYDAQLATSPQELQVTPNTVSSFVRLITKSYPRVCVFIGSVSSGAEPDEAKVVLFPQLADGAWSLVALLVNHHQVLVFEWAGMSPAAAQRMAKVTPRSRWLC